MQAEGTSSFGPARPDEVIELLSSEGEPVEYAGSQPSQEQLAATSCSPVCGEALGNSCRCKKDSQHCLARLLPSATSFRKKGLWQRDVEELLDGVSKPAGISREVR